MSTRNILAILGMAILLEVLCSGCSRRVDLRPGRDAYYQVTNQQVPAQSSGSHSQSATMIASGVIGSTESIPVDRNTTGPAWAN